MPTINPARVRYIKLGEKGIWEKECLDKSMIRTGLDGATAERFPLCSARQWDELMRSFIARGRTQRIATRFTNEIRLFFEDDGSTLWITFVGQRLWWGLLQPSPAELHEDGDSVRRAVAGGWCGTDLNGEPLTKDRLSGAVTMLAAYRGTSCKVVRAEDVVRRINGHTTPEVERAVATLKTLKASVVDLMKLLGPRDFETLVDLVFTTSGWRRLGEVGKTQKTLDLDLVLPSTGDRAFVQVKSNTTSAELGEYVGKIEEDVYDRMFYVYHSGEAATDHERVTVIGPEKLADLVLDAGLVNWL